MLAFKAVDRGSTEFGRSKRWELKFARSQLPVFKAGAVAVFLQCHVNVASPDLAQLLANFWSVINRVNATLIRNVVANSTIDEVILRSSQRLTRGSVPLLLTEPAAKKRRRKSAISGRNMDDDLFELFYNRI